MQRLGEFAKTSQNLATTGRSSRCSATKAADRASVLIGCYRKGDAIDSEVYATALVAVLSAYSEAIVARVTDPRTGLPGRSQWLPTIFEVRQACEHEMQPIRDEEARRARRAQSEANMRGAEEDRARRRTYAELAQAYPDVVGQLKPKALTVAEKEALYAGLGARRDLRAPLEPSDRIRETLAADRP